MRSMALLVGVIVLAATSSGFAQTPAKGTSGPADAINAVLTGSLDARKATRGQVVRAKIVEDRNRDDASLPKDTILIGEVTQAHPHAKDRPSELAFTFRRALSSDGKET